MSEKEEYSITDLREMSAEQANTELDESDFKRWQQLDELKKQASENREKVREDENEAMNTLIKAADNRLTTTFEIDGVEFEAKLTMNRKQRDFLYNLKQIADKNTDKMNEKEIKTIEKQMIKLLSDICLNFDKSDWKKFAENNGLAGLNLYGGKIWQNIRDAQEDMGEAVENFRGQAGRGSD